MKNILFMVTKSENGGAQKWTKEQIEICSKDFNVFLATDENGWLSKNVKVKNKFLNNLILKRLSFIYLLKLNKFIIDNNINLVVSSSANAGIYSRLIKLLNKKIKVIYVSHGWSSIYNGGKLKLLYVFIEKQLSKISDSILCISKKDFENAQYIIGVDKSKLQLITNKIYPIKLINKPIKINNIIRIVTVARLVAPKRIDLLIEATKNLSNIELHIIGDGVLRKDLEKNKYKNVFFHGNIDSFDDYGSYDIFALISDSEGIPLAALEAMCCSMPIIVSNVGGCSELIDDNGFLVENNVKSIADAIALSIRNLGLLGKKSKEIFDSRFNLELDKNIYLEYYNNILKKYKVKNNS
ncbi:glycosyltransferase family 4 protein [Campylobacter hyointestinalis]|uniref:glycosyltransferase n=1 Tax=Campylobacter hyointestinalis TaxID=198 RepID=UPI00068B930B|nr:glycosyltransferase [Campylobacter hyointestinalis]QKF54946.1 glycosyltransferase, family 1 [Campylobacter hyointestinalis subsp. hyointestinalis]TXK47817.1 glycosyltransferase family 4 protein [Campylobacter hyointestinalis]SFT60058.1 Glycosyltransferase involved in cell wall bisynthesis [Campylobacter hyointestinalis]